MIGNRRRRTHEARAVVTGAGSGIGAAFAVELARRGSAVVCSDIDASTARRTADKIRDRGGKAVEMKADVADLGDVERLADEAADWFGAETTLVVNNAGVGAGGARVGETPVEDWTWTLGINLWGPIHGCHVFVPRLRRVDGDAGVINVASAASFGAAPGMAAYNVSKAGVLSLSETLAAELSGTGIAVTALCPTFVKTNILDSPRVTGRSQDLAATLIRFGMSPQRVARTCLDTHDRGGLYCMPQLEAKLGWHAKRHAPATFTHAAGLVGRLGPLRGTDRAD